MVLDEQKIICTVILNKFSSSKQSLLKNVLYRVFKSSGDKVHFFCKLPFSFSDMYDGVEGPFI